MLLILTFVCPFILIGLITSDSAEEAYPPPLFFLPWFVVAVWWLIDFLRIPGLTRKYNSKLAQRLGQS